VKTFCGSFERGGLVGPKIVLTAKAILTGHRARPLMDGFVLIGGNRILEVGPRKDLRFLPSVRLLDLGDTILLPGLINAHGHLDYTCLEGRVPYRGRFREWLTAMATATRSLTRADFRDSIREGIRRSLALGTTTFCDVSTSGESYGVLKRSPLRAQVFFECLDFGLDDPVGVWHRALDRARRATAMPPHPSTLRWGLSPHTPFTVSNELFYQMGRYVQQHPRLSTMIHVGESREEGRYFATGRGPIAQRARRLCPTWPIPTAKTSVGHLRERGWLPKLDLAVHCNIVEERDLRSLARNRVAVVHCPGSHAFFILRRIRYKAFKENGVRVCLGTDSLASNASLSMFREMRLFRKANPAVPAAEVLTLATDQAARAIGMGKELGQVRPGYLADLIGIPLEGPPSRDLEACAERVLSQEGEVTFSMVDGKIPMRLMGRGSGGAATS